MRVCVCASAGNLCPLCYYSGQIYDQDNESCH